MSEKIRIRYTEGYKGLPELKVTEVGDWVDLRSECRYEIKEGDYVQISLGVAMELPEGNEAWVAPRSSTFKKWGLLQVNSPGIIDESYCGNENIWSYHCIATRDTVVERGDRVCQFRVMPKMATIYPSLELEEVEDLGNKNRGMSGHTGR